MGAGLRVNNHIDGRTVIAFLLHRDGSHARRCTKQVCAGYYTMWLWDTHLAQMHSTDLRIFVSIERSNRAI